MLKKGTFPRNTLSKSRLLWSKVSVAPLPPPPPPPEKCCTKRFPSSAGNLDDSELNTRLQINILCQQFCLRLEVVHQSHFSKLAPQAAYHRTSAGDFALWFSFAFFGQLHGQKDARIFQLALRQLSITPPVQPGAAPCVQHISIMVPWYYVVRAAGLASAPSSVHGKRNNPWAFLWSLPSRWAIDGEFKLGQRESWPIGSWSFWATSTLGGPTAPWSSSPAQSAPFPTQSPGSFVAVALQFLSGMDSAERRSRRNFPWTC